MPLMNDTKRFLKWLWQCAGKTRRAEPWMNYTLYALMGATMIRNNRISQSTVEHKQDEQEKAQFANEGKDGLGITRHLEAAQARRSIEPCDVPSPSPKEADVD